MTRVTAVLFALMLCGGSFVANAQEKQPNIIFIISDSHRAEALGVAGHPFVQTPNLDKLADVRKRLCYDSHLHWKQGELL